jgi:hypothetical protein
MSYAKELDDYTTGQLCDEVARRKRCQKIGKCWYCGKPLDEHACRMRARRDVRAPGQGEETNG